MTELKALHFLNPRVKSLFPSAPESKSPPDSKEIRQQFHTILIMARLVRSQGNLFWRVGHPAERNWDCPRHAHQRHASSWGSCGSQKTAAGDYPARASNATAAACQCISLFTSRRLSVTLLGPSLPWD